jgi:hypothetical protein
VGWTEVQTGHIANILNRAHTFILHLCAVIIGKGLEIRAGACVSGCPALMLNLALERCSPNLLLRMQKTCSLPQKKQSFLCTPRSLMQASGGAGDELDCSD